MSKYFAIPIALALTIALASSIYCQDIEPRISNFVNIVSDPSGAELYKEDSLIGVTPLAVEKSVVSSLVLYYPARNAWQASSARITEPVVLSNEGVVLVRFDVTKRIITTPFGAAVYENDSLLGYAPLDVTIREESRALHIEKPGYKSYSLRLSRIDEAKVYIVLEHDSFIVSENFSVVQETGFKMPSEFVLIPGGLGLSAGVFAVIMKQQADKYYEEYQRTGDESLLSKTRRYDVFAGISLAVLQLCVGYFVYLLYIDT